MTPEQLRILDFVRDRITEVGHAPTIRETATAQRLSVTGAHKIIDALVSSGKLRRTPAASRGLEVVDAIDLRGVGTSALRAELARRGETLEALPSGRGLATGTKQTCAADTCGAPVQRGQLMCRTHWFALPRDLRDDILTTHARALRYRRGEDVTRYQELVAQARDVADGLGGRA